MSSPILRRILLTIIRGSQAVGRSTAFVFSTLTKPLHGIGHVIFSFIVLPIYQVIRRMKRVVRHHPGSFLELVMGQGLPALTIGLIWCIVIIINISGPQRVHAETIGQKTILFTLTKDENSEISDTVIIVPTERRVSRYYTRDDRYLLWQILAPTKPEESIGDVQTTFGGSTLVTPSIPGGSLPPSIVARREPFVYRVQPGDTLSSIAERFNISVETILWENNLRVTSLLRLGQELSILPASGITHRVTRGQTLAGLARLYDITPEEIAATNGINREGSLRVGQDLFIPGGRRITSTFVARPQQPRVITSAPTIVARPTATTLGRFLWPTSGHKLNQYFTWRHTGIDIDGDYTSPIYATDDGVITVSGWGSGYGIHVDIDHGNGYKTRYGHHSKNFVRVGDKVKRGQLIAMMGSTGRSTGVHLHFEIIVNGRRVNPLNYIR